MISVSRQLFRFALSISLWIAAILCVAWSTGAIYHFDLIAPWLAILLCASYVCFSVITFWNSRNTNHWPAIALGSFMSVWLLTLLQQPSHRREWVEEQSRLPAIKLVDDAVTIQNFRSCSYRSETDFDVDYRDVGFEIESLRRVWFVVQYFSADERLAHVMLSFELDVDPARGSVIGSTSAAGSDSAVSVSAPPRYFSLSVEIRREIGESYSPLKGMYREYELNYVIGEEADLIGVRTVMRDEDRVHMYPVNADAAQVQALFQDIATRVNDLDRRPEYYHTFFNNCLNSIVGHTYQLTPEPINWLDPRIVLPGYSDHFAWSEGLIGRKQETFEDLKSRCRIDRIARDNGLNPDFSKAIRAHNDR